MTARVECLRCGSVVVRATSGRLLCSTPGCAGPESPARVERDFSGWMPYEPPEVAGDQQDDRDGRWWTS